MVGKVLKQNEQFINFLSSTNYGSSGGPILDENGNLVGIMNAYFED